MQQREGDTSFERLFQDFAICDKDIYLFNKFTISEVNCKENNILPEVYKYTKNLMDHKKP